MHFHVKLGGSVAIPKGLYSQLLQIYYDDLMNLVDGAIRYNTVIISTICKKKSRKKTNSTAYGPFVMLRATAETF